MLDTLLNAFVVLFIVVDPVGVASIFVALSARSDKTVARRMALTAVVLAGAMLMAFYLIGDTLLGWMGISLPAFKIAGGILLLLLSIDMVFARQSGLRSTTAGEEYEARHKEDITVFPLAFPLLAGPGALTTVLLMSAQATSEVLFWGMLVIIVVVLVAAFLSLLAATWLRHLLGETGTNVINRLLGLILAALSVQYVIDGIRQSFMPGA